MTNYICIYLNSTKVKLTGNLIVDNKIIITLQSKKEVDFEKWSEVIFLDWNSNQKHYFRAFGIIQSFKTIEKTTKFFLFEIEIQIQGILNEITQLQDFVYSLKKVYRYLKPQNHFNRSYTYLQKEDYYTIINGRIFIARTVFGKILNALPPEHVQNIVIRLMETQGISFFKIRDYRVALQELQKYVIEEIENRGNFLIQSEELIRDHLGELVSIREIGFIDEEGDEKQDYLTEQTELFRNLFSTIKEYDLWSEISREIEAQYEVQENFNESFYNIEWPIKYEDL